MLSFVPTVLLLAYFHGGSGRRKWVTAEKIGVGANLAASAALLIFLFSGKSLGAATTTVTLKNEEGLSVERVIPKNEFVKRIAVFFFDNKTKDPSQNWIQYAIPMLLHFDLLQDHFIYADKGYDFFDRVKTAGFQEGVGLPLTLKSSIAGDLHDKYLISGSFSKEGEELVIETSIYETKRATEITKSEFRGQDIFKLTDQMSLKIRRDLGVPEQYIRDAKDLPVSEMVTASAQALKSFVEGANAIVFEQDWAKGLKKFEESVTEDPTFAYAYFDIQKYAVLMNQREKSEQAFRSLMQHLYKFPEWLQYLFKSEYYAFKGEVEKQIAVLKMMVELNPADIAGHMRLTSIYQERSQLDNAIAEVQRILEIDPEFKNALLKMGSLYEQKGELEEALKYYEKYAAQYPQEVISFTAVGDVYRAMGDFERAKSYFERALLIEPENISVLITRANIESDMGNFEGTEKLCQEALANARTPQEKIQVYESLSSVFDTQGRYRKSLECTLLLLEELGKTRPPFLTLVSKINYLRKFTRAGQKDEALKIVEEIRNQATPPFDQLVPLAYLDIYVVLEDVEKAAKALKDVVSIPLAPMFENNRPIIIFYQGRIFEMKGEYQQAITEYNRFSEVWPNALGVNLVIGRCYRKLKEFEKAEEILLKNLKTNPFSPELHYELSLVYIDTKDNKKAIEHLKIALDVWKNADPGLPEVEDARKRLAGLTGS
jgi:tetratricopeptide (TPR) repeat protein